MRGGDGESLWDQQQWVSRCLVPALRGKERKEVAPGTHRDSLMTRAVASVLGWGLSEIDLKTKILAQVVYLGSNPRGPVRE